MAAIAARKALPPSGRKICAARHWWASSRRARLAPHSKERAAPFERHGTEVRPPRSVRRRRRTLIRKTVSTRRAPSRLPQAEETLLTRILASLDADKAEDIVTIDLEGRSSIADALV